MGATATLRGKITLNDNLFMAGLRRVKGAAIGLGSTLGRALKSVTSGPIGMIGGLLAGIGSAMAGLSGISALSEFGVQMAQVAAVSGATSEELKTLSARARTMGGAFTAAQAAEGMATLAQAGFKVNEVLSATEPLLNLATAGGIGLAEAMTVATGIMGPFNLKAADAGRIADVLAQAASSTNAGVNDMGQAMNAVAPVAGQLGLRFEEVAAALGEMSSGNIKGERAGTALRAILARLVKPSAEVTEGLASIGVTARDVNPATHSLADILATIGAAQERVGSKTAAAASNVGIFGMEAASAGGILLQQRAQLKGLTADLNSSGGAAKKMAGIMGDQLGGDIDKLQAASKRAVLALGEAGLTDVLRSATQAATAFIEKLGGEGAGKLGGAFQTIKDGFSNPGMLLDAFILYLKAGTADVLNGLINGSIKAAFLFVEGLKMVWTIIKSSGLAFAGVATVFTGALLEGIGNAGAYMYAGLAFAMQSALEFFDGGWRPILASLKTGLVNAFSSAVEGLKKGFDALWNGAKAFWQGLLNAISKIPGLTKDAKDALLGAFKKGPEQAPAPAPAPAPREQYKAKGFGELLAQAQGMSGIRGAGLKTKAVGEDLLKQADAGFDSLGDSFEKFKEGAVNVIRANVGQDFLGAEEYRKQMRAALETMHKAAEKGIKEAAPAKAIPVDPWAKFRKFSTFREGLMIQSSSALKSGGLQTSGALGASGKSTSLLSVRERRAFEDAKVANGATRQGGPNTFNSYRRGDRARAREVAKQRARELEGTEKTNDLLGQLVTTTKNAWE